MSEEERMEVGKEGSMSEACDVLVESAYRLTAYLESVKQELEAGEVVDLSDIQERVATICEKTAELEKHEALIMMLPLRELMGMMESVSLVLEEKRQDLLVKSREEGG